MNWKGLGKIVGGAAPVLGSLLGGPAGGAAGALVAKAFGCEETPEAVEQAVSQDPDALVKLKQIESDERITLAELSLQEKQMVVQSGSDDIRTVNETIRVESGSSKWYVAAWRPFNGFLFGITLFCVYFLLPVMEKEAPEIDMWVWMAWASVLGVTSWHRGMKQRLDSGEVGQSGIVGAIANRIKR